MTARFRLLSVIGLGTALCAALLAEMWWGQGGIVRLPFRLARHVGGLPLPVVFWLSLAAYAWAYGRLFQLPQRELWVRAIRLGFGLHALVLIASLAWYLAGISPASLSGWYLLYWRTLWVGVLACGMAGFGWAAARWVRARTADPWLFFLPLVGGYLTVWASAAAMPLPLAVAAGAGGAALLAASRVHRLRVWTGRLRDWLANERPFLILIFLSALALRLFYATRVMSDPGYLHTGSDGATYDALAWAMAQGQPAPVESLPWWAVQFFTPGYVRFVALIYWIAGRSYFAVCAVQSVIGAGACLLLYDVAKRLFGVTVARLSAGFGVVSFPLIFAAVAIGHQAMDLFLTLVVVWCLLKYADDPARWGRWMAAVGLLLGWAAVTREGNIVLWAALPAWFLLGVRAKLGWRRALLHVAGLSVGFLAVLLPFLQGAGDGVMARLDLQWFYHQYTATHINDWFNPWRDPGAAWALFQAQPLTVIAKVGEAMAGNFNALFLDQGYGSFDPVFLVRGSPYYYGMWSYALLFAFVGLGLVLRQAWRMPAAHLGWWLLIVVLLSRASVHLVLQSTYRHRAPFEPYLIMLAALGFASLMRVGSAPDRSERSARHTLGPLRALLKRLHAPVYQSRIRELARSISPHLREGDRVLDVGCGSGLLGRAILDAASCPPRVQLHGAERSPRGNEPIEVRAYDGRTLPYGEKTYDTVILADVLHHADEPEQLVSECARVSKRLLIIKDHQVKGFLAKPRLVLLDWVANAPFGVPCPYRFWTPAQWTAVFRRHQLSVVDEVTSMNPYQIGLNLVFGGSLQYLAVVKVPMAVEDTQADHGAGRVSAKHRREALT